MKYIVKAKNEKYNGTTAGVRFYDGVGETESEEIATYLKDKGYILEAEKAKKADKKENDKISTKESEEASDEEGATEGAATAEVETEDSETEISQTSKKGGKDK